jgi:hypothetical protein
MRSCMQVCDSISWRSIQYLPTYNSTKWNSTKRSVSLIVLEESSVHVGSVPRNQSTPPSWPSLDKQIVVSASLHSIPWKPHSYTRIYLTRVRVILEWPWFLVHNLSNLSRFGNGSSSNWMGLLKFLGELEWNSLAEYSELLLSISFKILLQLNSCLLSIIQPCTAL